MSTRTKPRKLEWAKYADFRYRNSKDDLAKLCSKYDASKLKKAFRTVDETGLCPIHWAAIHNRSDMIEFMLNNGSPSRIKCKNKLFADGTALHLAAMNGSIEAAEVLLNRRGSSRGHQTEPEVVASEDKVKPTDQAGAEKEDREETSRSLLEERDAEGQTPLMRSAAPRSKRLDTVRDLLRKNSWSLSGRPAEMALYLISRGADWRQTDSVQGLNLMHLAIINDYDDIVNMLLVIDKKLVTIPAKFSATATSTETSLQADKPTTSPSGSMNSSDSSDSSKLLIPKQERSKSLIVNGMTPLQLAIVYGRLSIISLLWFASKQTNSPSQLAHQGSDESQSKVHLKNTLMRVYWTNRAQLFQFFRRSFLKFALMLDLAILTLLWLPVNLKDGYDGPGRPLSSVESGIFIMSYCVSLTLGLRVILKNPGYLRRNSLQYLKELKSIVGAGPDQEQDDTKGNQTSTNENDKLQQNDTKETTPNKQSDYNKSNLEGSAQSQPDLSERVRLLCHKCRCIRRPRSRHCNDCNHCVQDFDHHCIYLSCCIGRKNRLDFLLLMVSLTLTSLYGTILHTTRSRSIVGLIWVLKYALIGTFYAFSILRRACLGVTMYEEIRSDRIRTIFGPSGPSESISKSHRIYSTHKGSFWRFSPDRFLAGDLPARAVIYNLKEFVNFASPQDLLISLTCTDTPLNRSISSNDSKIDLYKYL